MEKVQQYKFEVAIERIKKVLENEISKRNPEHDHLALLKKSLVEAYKEEEIYWKDRSREQWLQTGDKNTKYFQNCVKSKKVKNRIHMLQDEHGLERFSKGSKGVVVVDYFRELFKSSGPEDLDDLFEEFAPRVTEDMNRMLVAPVTDQEIKQAVSSIKGGSDAGPDGFNGKFYQHH